MLFHHSIVSGNIIDAKVIKKGLMEAKLDSYQIMDNEFFIMYPSQNSSQGLHVEHCSTFFHANVGT